MDIDIKCNKLEARYGLDNAILRCVEPYVFKIARSHYIEISIQEIGVRIVTLSSNEESKVSELYAILTKLERLLNILDGSFLQLQDIKIQGHAKENEYYAMVAHIKAQRLKYYKISTLLSVLNDRLIDYEKIVNEALLQSWSELLEELDVINQIYLYATCDNGFTNDVKCAFLTELAESLVEVIGIENLLESENELKPDKSLTLRKCLELIINQYGTILFRREIDFGLDCVLKSLVNNRVNIMHVKVNKRTPKLNGAEAALYVFKMSYLYRIVLFEKLNIDHAIYDSKLKKKTDQLDQWNGILDEFFARLE